MRSHYKFHRITLSFVFRTRLSLYNKISIANNDYLVTFYCYTSDRSQIHFGYHLTLN